MSIGRCAIALVAAIAVGAATLETDRARSEVQVASAEATDVLLAFDTTGSMVPSIAAAQRDAETIVSAVGGFAPNTRFAVASFRDRFYPGGQYTLVSPMTASTGAVTAAIDTLNAVSTTDSAQNSDAEAYNLLFNKSYTDSRIGWRAASRKIVVVIGDAEPHSAGAEGLTGCADTTLDWNNLSTKRELAGMQAAKRTLVMIRQAKTATASLACYSTLASLAYEGGSARDGGSKDIGAPLIALLKQAYAPFSLTSQLERAVTGKTNGLTVRIANPNTFPLEVSDLSVKLPAGVVLVPSSVSGTLPKPVARDGRLTWSLTAPLKPLQVLSGHIVLRYAKAGAALLAGSMTVMSPDGTAVTSKSKAPVRLVRRPGSLTLTVDGTRSAAALQGATASTLSSAKAARGTGTVVFLAGSGKSVTLRAASAAATTIGAPSNVSIRVSVARTKGFAACPVGANGVLKVTDSDRLTRSGKTRDRLTLVLPAACGGSKAFADAGAGGRLSVKLGFR